MGCDIHIITEIRKDGEWRYVPDTPEILKGRNYKTFAGLAGVRDDFGNQVFEPKGLPDDLSAKKFEFGSLREFIDKMYHKDSMTVFVGDDGTISCEWKPSIEIDNITYEKIHKGIEDGDAEICRRYRNAYWSRTGDEQKYHVEDAEKYGGHFETKPLTEIFPTVEDFAKARFDDDWDEDAQDYGSWNVNFECEDYHTPSYLTLEELENGDYTKFTSHKYKMEREFYDAFIAAGGTFPDKFKVYTEPLATDFLSCIRESICPVVTIMWQADKEEQIELPELMKGIDELKEVAKKYEVAPCDIRIVFAFDN